MAITATANIAGIMRTIVDPVLKNYAKKKVVLLPATYVKDIADGGGKAVNFPIPTKDSAAAVAEDADITATANAWTSVTATCSEVGIGRSVSKMARRANIMGEAEYLQWLIEDGGLLVYEKMETDVWAQLANASTSAGTTTLPMDIPTAMAMLDQHAINESSGQVSLYFGPKGLSDLRQSIITTTGTVFSTGVGSGLLAQPREDGFCGFFAGYPVWFSSCRATANAGADEVSGAVVNGAENPGEAATSAAVLWWPEPEAADDDASARQKEQVITACYGLIESVDRSYVKGISRAS